METGSMIHSTLKQSTRDLHFALESKLRPLLCDQLSLDQYASISKRFYGFYRPIEGRLLSVVGWDDPEFKLSSRLKLRLLIDDLAALAVGSEELAGLPMCDSLPRLETVSEALGCLYVLEGSTLGGKIICGCLKKGLFLEESRGCSFFNSYGDDVGRMWSSFLGTLTRHCERHRAADVVVRSACQTFASLDRWFPNA
jgi:heme oxygenase